MKIQPYSQNAKKHPESQLKALAAIVKEVGWRQPVLVNQEGVIVAGHGRFFTFEKFGEALGLKPIWVMDDKGNTINGAAETEPLTPEQEKAYRLADNKLNESDWDLALVRKELQDLPLPLLDLTGFSRNLITDTDERDDVVPAVPQTPKTAYGDVYLLGKHRLICGDATKPADFDTLMQGQKADLLFTDPPYNVNYSGRGENTSTNIMNDSMSDELFKEFLNSTFANIKANLKGGAGLYVFHSTSTQAQFEEALNLNGIEVRNQLIWNKPVASMGWGDYRWKHEPFFYAAQKGTPPHFYGDRTNTTVLDFQKTDQELAAWAKRQHEAERQGKTTIWTMKRESVTDYVHPTQKPVELIMYALNNSSKVEDVVLDPFLGSGSTLIACEKANRVCFGSELDPKFADVIVQRYVDYSGNGEVIKNGVICQDFEPQEK